jgi:hypothetical protein
MEELLALVARMGHMQEAEREQKEGERRLQERINATILARLEALTAAGGQGASLPTAAERGPLTARRELFAPPRPLLPFSSPQRTGGLGARASAWPPASTSAGLGAAAASSPRVAGPARRHVKAPEPKKFKGTEGERLGAREWLRSADDYLSLVASDLPPAQQLMLFGLLLEGTAQTWFQSHREREGEGFDLERAYQAFLQQYTGGLTTSLLQAELDGLQYGRGERAIKDLTALNARFDALISQLYPDSWTHPTTSALLARAYEKIILKGDDELWQEAKRRGPVGIDEWKVAVQEAFVLLRELRARGNPRADSSRYASGAGGGSRGFSQRSTPSSGAGHQPAASARVNGLQAEEGEEGETWERGEGESEAESLQQLGTGAKKGAQASSSHTGRKENRGRPLSDAERTQLRAAGRCFQCFQQGHVARDESCPGRGKPRRKPTGEELKA